MKYNLSAPLEFGFPPSLSPQVVPVSPAQMYRTTTQVSISTLSIELYVHEFVSEDGSYIHTSGECLGNPRRFPCPCPLNQGPKPSLFADRRLRISRVAALNIHHVVVYEA